MKSPLIIIATAGTGGDMFPFITIAQGLCDRGHRVMLLVPAFQERIVQASGLPYHTFGTQEQGQALLDNPDVWDARKGWGMIWSGLQPNLSAIREMVQRLSDDEPCVVLTHSMLAPMAALARSVRVDLHIVSVYLAPSSLCSSYDMLTVGPMRIPSWIPLSWRQHLWRLIHKTWTDPVSLPGLNEARVHYQLPPVAHFFEHMIMAPNASMGFYPSWFASAQPDWPEPFLECDFVNVGKPKDQAPLPADLEQFLTDGEPPILFTPGTGHLHAADYFKTALAALQKLGRRGLFVTPHIAQLPAALPADILWQAHAPFSQLFPRVAAVVHHGGIGTMAEAFRAGIPQLIVTFAYDQFDNGLRAKRLGVADVLSSTALSARKMHVKLRDILTSQEVKRNCSTVSSYMAKSEISRLFSQVEAALFPNSSSSQRISGA